MDSKRVKILCMILMLPCATSQGAQSSPPSTVGLLAAASLVGLGAGGAAWWIKSAVSNIDIDVRSRIESVRQDLSGRIEVVASSLGQAQEKLKRLLTGQQQLEQASERLEEGQGRLLAGQEAISHDVRTLNEGMYEVRNGTRTLQEGQGRIEVRVESMHSHVEGVSRQLTEVNGHLGSHGTQLESLNVASQQELKIVKNIEATQIHHTVLLEQLKSKLDDIEKNGGTKEDLTQQVVALTLLIKGYNDTAVAKIVSLESSMQSELRTLKGEMQTMNGQLVEIASKCATLMERFDGFSESLKKEIKQIIEQAISAEFERQRGLEGSSKSLVHHSLVRGSAKERRS